MNITNLTFSAADGDQIYHILCGDSVISVTLFPNFHPHFTHFM